MAVYLVGFVRVSRPSCNTLPPACIIIPPSTTPGFLPTSSRYIHGGTSLRCIEVPFALDLIGRVQSAWCIHGVAGAEGRYVDVLWRQRDCWIRSSGSEEAIDGRANKFQGNDVERSQCVRGIVNLHATCVYLHALPPYQRFTFVFASSFSFLLLAFV